MKYEEISIKSKIEKCGVNINLDIWENGKNSPVIIFLPGTMAHPLIYEDFLMKLSENGFNVLGVSFVSHGKSDKSEYYTFNDMLINIRDSVDYAIKRWNANICVMGSSQGGILASVYAAKDDRVKCVFPHNIADTDMKESLSITKLPKFLYLFFKPAKYFIKMSGKMFPNFQINLTSYLNLKKIFKNKEEADNILKDPLLLHSYPLCFISSLFNADTSGLFDGSIKCPFVLITATGDPLFDYEYTKKVFDKVNAPKKEIIVIDKKSHMIFNEHTDFVLSLVLPKLKEYLSV